MPELNNAPSVVLVHDCFVDGSGWQPVYRLLRNDGSPSASSSHRRWPSTVTSRPRASPSTRRSDPSSSWDTPTGEP